MSSRRRATDRPFRNAALRRLLAAFFLGVLTTLLLAAVLPLLLLRYNVITHRDAWSDAPAYVDGRILSLRRSTLALSDWVQVLPSSAGIRTMPEARIPSWAAVPAPGVSFDRVDTGATGWPLRALASESWFRTDPATGRSVEELRWNLTLAKTPSGRIMFPLRPIWRGVVVDVLALGAAWWVALAIPVWLRSRRRLALGLCPRCGFDLAGAVAPGCPECGWGRDDTHATRR